MPTTQTSDTTVAPTTQQQPTVEVKPDFGNGRYSPLMEEVFHDAKIVFGLEPDKAEKLARRIAGDFGDLMSQASIGVRSIKLGKVSKDGKLTVTEAASKLKGVTLTNSLFALRALQYAGQAGDMGFVFNKTQWANGQVLERIFSKL